VLLLGELYYAYAGSHNNTITSIAVKPTSNVQQIILLNETHDNKIVKNTSVCEITESFISDEDEDNLFGRKYVLPALAYFILIYTFLLSYIYSCVKASLPTCAHLFYASSYKYLTLRTLRI
jgi:hypothetical protein